MMARRLGVLFLFITAFGGFIYAQAPAESSPVIRSESRLVLVDAVVTDKKGNYVHDLTKKDFKVWEDGKEQNLTSFSTESDSNAPAKGQKRYLVLFFDNSTSSLSDQIQARAAATKFIDSNAGPNRPIAVVDFSGALRVSQNFTEDADRLKKVVSGAKFSSVGPTSDAGGPSLGGGFTNFSTRSVILALRDLAKRLATVPGRKTLVFISAGFPMDNDHLSELTATIDACNRANVAVYPIDVRGLVASPPSSGPRGSLLHPVGRLAFGAGECSRSSGRRSFAAARVFSERRARTRGRNRLSGWTHQRTLRSAWGRNWWRTGRRCLGTLGGKRQFWITGRWGRFHARELDVPQPRRHKHDAPDCASLC